MNEVRKNIDAQPSFPGATAVSPPTNTVVADDMHRAIATAIADCHTRISDVKRGVDAVKIDYTKEIALLESSLSRKIEANVNKMLNDKIAVALEAHHGVIKDIVATELSAQPQATETTGPAPDDDFEMSVTLAGAPAPAVTPAAPATPAPVKRGRKVKLVETVGNDKDA